MLSRISGINKFGGYSWEIEFDSLFRIFIHETIDNKFVIEFKEWKFFSYKLHFSFVSNESFFDTIINSFDNVYDWFESNPKFIWTKQQNDNKLNEVLSLLKMSKFYNNLDTQVSIGKKYSIIIDTFKQYEYFKFEESIDCFCISYSFESRQNYFFLKEKNETILVDLFIPETNKAFIFNWVFSLGTEQNLILTKFNKDYDGKIKKQILDTLINELTFRKYNSGITKQMEYDAMQLLLKAIELKEKKCYNTAKSLVLNSLSINFNDIYATLFYFSLLINKDIVELESLIFNYKTARNLYVKINEKLVNGAWYFDQQQVELWQDLKIEFSSFNNFLIDKLN